MPNPQVMSQLAPAERVTEIYAQLLDLSDKVVYSFLYNPETIKWNRKANYVAAPTSATSTPAQQYLHTDGKTFQFSELLLQSYGDGKSLRSLLEGLEALLVVDPQGNSFAPKQVVFSWGTMRIGPAFLTSIDCTETLWLGGEVAEARVSLSLMSVPESDGAPTESGAPTTTTSEIALTDRQREDARKAAADWLSKNQNSLPTSVRDLVRAGRFRYLTNASGQVSITDSAGKVLGVVGTHDGETFDATEGTLASATAQ
jgi:hypothetical protein